MTEPGSILVISLRFLGDVLLTTPLIRSMRAAYPGAAIDALVFTGMEGVLEGNPDLRSVLTTERGEPLALWRRLWRSYDLAVVAETADRPHLCGLIAGRRRVGLLPPERDKAWWKRLSLSHGVVSPRDLARPVAYERLAAALGIGWKPEMVAPSAQMPEVAWRDVLGFDPGRERFAVLHLAPRFRYKRWNIPGWHALMAWLHGEKLRVVITGGPGEVERAYVREVLAGAKTPVTDLCGRLRFAQTADLLRRAALYVGPDTATTHLAAACGTPTVALFGPTDPRLWGPHPKGGLQRPYEKVAAIQFRDKVSLLQEPSLACVPCQGEGCDKHPESHSECLDRMSAARVIDAAREALRTGAAAARP
ncbi:MAG TPA: glycosyltransferase family 9 protein [Burkholderiales bacterium]|nr:glycosyltransferase family 9 protein [Burkholderiales bacterium]